MRLCKLIPLSLLLVLALPGAPLRAAEAASGKTAEAGDSVSVPAKAVIVEAGTIVYEAPDVLANALRLLYAGEVVDVREIIRDPNQAKWAKIRMGEAYGYVKYAKIRHGGTMPIREWKPPVILREEKPLSFSLKMGAEMFGGGLDIHYLPFSRLGGTFSVGSIVDWPEMKGTSLAMGVISYLALRDFSPFVEMGFTRLSYHENYSTLRVNAFYLSFGIEWIFPSGFFMNGSMTYLRSADVEVAFDYANAKSGLTEVPADFGILDPGNDNTFQFVSPGLALGYAF